VFFRQSCKHEADRLGIRGWARNLDSGGVEVMAQGDALVVDQLDAWCRVGPPRALVTKVTVTDLPLDPADPTLPFGFSVR
jgi:acylphosphatase